MDDHTERKLTEFVQRTPAIESIEEAKPAFEDKLEVVEERLMEDANDQEKVDYAIAMLSSEDLRERRTGLSGKPMELKILAIGHRGVWTDFGKDDIDTVLSHAIIHGPLDGANQDNRAAVAIMFNQKPDLDLLDVQNKFTELNELTATYEVEDAWNVDGMYRCYSSSATDIAEADLDALPSSRDDKNAMLRRIFEDVELVDIADDGSAGLSSYDPDSGYTDDYGVDIQRFSGRIVSHYIKDDRSWGRYTVVDDSLTEDELLASDLTGENQSVPGLTVHCIPDHHMEYGDDSIVDVYGPVEVDDNGQPVMRAAGIVPVVPSPMDSDDEADSNVQKQKEAI